MRARPSVDSGTVLSSDQVAAFRLARHHLAKRAPRRDLAVVIADVCGIQAQVRSAAELALRARIEGLAKEDVARALWRDRSLVKTWAMRGATHILPAAELPSYLSALARRESRSTAWILRRGLPAGDIDAIVDAIGTALEAGPLLRKELADRVSEALGPRARRWVEHTWGGVVQIACIRGRACFGPYRGNEVTFVRLDEWVRGVQDEPWEEAAVALLRRYLRANGPATLQDFAQWAGFAVADARTTGDRLGEEMAGVAVEGRGAWALRVDLPVLRTAKRAGPTVRLLPSFDSFLLAHKDKGHLVDAAHYKRVYRKAGWLSPVVLVDGRVAGIWSYERKGERLRMNVDSFARFSRAVREGIEAEAEDVARFFDARCELRVR